MAKKQTTTTIPLSGIGRAVITTYIRHLSAKIYSDHKENGIDWAKKQAEKLFEAALDSGKIIQWGCVGISRDIPAFEGTGSITITI